MKQLLPIFKALANEIRLSLYEMICHYGFLTKSQIMKMLEIDNRPSLEHHLALLKEADLLDEKEIFFDNQRLVFLVPIRKLNFSKDQVITYPDAFNALNRLGDKLTSMNYNELIDQEPDGALRVSLRHALGNAILATGRKFRCELCQGLEPNKATIICQSCGRFICHDCSRNIKRPTDIIEVYCKKCEKEFFFTRY